MPTVSVIIPTCNRRPCLQEAIASVFAQTSAADELIIIDDGSTDDTAVWMQALAAEPSRPVVRYLRQDNAGPAAARNRGIAAARGEWIAFLDDDDAWLPAKLERQRAVLSHRPGLDLLGVASDLMPVRGQGAVVPVGLAALLVRNRFTTSGVLLRREAFHAVGGFREDMRCCEDYDLWLRIAARHGCAILDEMLVGYGKDKRGFGDSGLTADLTALARGERQAIVNWQRWSGAPRIVATIGLALCTLRAARRRLLAWRWRHGARHGASA